MRTGRILLALAVALSTLLTALSSSEAFAPRLVRLEAQQRLPAIDVWLRDESADINAVFLHYADDPALWMNAYLALLRYDDLARQVLLAYADMPAFQQVLSRLGPEVVLPIAYYREHDVATLRARHWLGERYRQASRWWRDESSTPGDSSRWNAYQRGQMGIALLDDEGHALLDQFVRDPQGEVHWLQSERVVAGVGDFFTSGIRELESQWRRDAAIGAADVGWAGVDLLLVANAVKVLRVGRMARSAGVARGDAQVARAGVRQGLLSGSARFATLPRMAKLAAITGTAYVVARHPSLISALGANVASWLGWPIWLGQCLVWCLVLLPLMIVMRAAWRWLVAPLGWLAMRLIVLARSRASR